MTALILATLCVGFVAVAEQAEGPATVPPPVVGAEGVTIHDIAGTTTLVTVVLKELGAQDKNLCVLEVLDDYFTVACPDGSTSAFAFDSVQEIRVQDGKVDTKKFRLQDASPLRAEQQKIVQRAYARAGEIYQMANDDQGAKMQAAMLLAVNRDEESRKYLEQLAASNDMATGLQALGLLYAVGSTPDAAISKALLSKGLESGNRSIRAVAADISGLLGDHSNEGFLATSMLQDRSADYAAPAARALARLGNRDCIPTLLRLITEPNEEKGESCIFALTRLGGPDVIEQMKYKYDSAVGEMRFRLARVLYNLGDPKGRELMADEFMQTHTLAPKASLILAKEGDWDAMTLLRGRLDRRYDEIREVLMFRADAALSLIAGGDPSYTSVLQELLRSDDVAVRLYVCRQIIVGGLHDLITITQPVIESPQPRVALAACTAAVALANPNEFRERLLELWAVTP
ncbi:MAG TPA: hypothetical protein PLO37_15150 [Candidatus Hydrogenedentes bacterium]|nr:hypothetical protein [Candidatus Hydrogenedentota bacterium]HPG68184.1 hypothetical protein [Candidatus Hydrogenedentota bacterium]